MVSLIRVDKTLAEIAAMVDGKIVGDKRLLITGLNGIKEAQAGDLTFLANPKYVALAKETKASAVLVGKANGLANKPHIIVDNPSYAFALIVKNIMRTDDYLPQGIHPTAVIAKDAKIGKNAAIGAHVVIESQATIGNGTKIMAGCFIGHGSVIGKDCQFYPNVTVRERVEIGDRVLIHSGTVVGSDGFGFEMVGGAHQKIPQIGTVIIEDDVEIGANCTIDRARFSKTVIGSGTKIDNLVQIGHNAIVGKNCIIVSQVALAGSATLEDGVVIAGQAAVGGHITVGKGTVITAKAGVIQSVPARKKVSGFPAMDHGTFMRAHVSFKKLPEHIRKIQSLTKRLERLEKKGK